MKTTINSYLDSKQTWLAIYQGGGYEGCYWEWNAFLIKDGQFVNLIATGNKGIETIAEIPEDFKGKKVNQSVHQLRIVEERYENMIDFLIIETEQGKKYLFKEFGEHLIKMIAEKLVEYDIELTAKCDECKQEFPVAEMFHTSSKGNGGIGVTYTGLACEDCLCELEHGEDL